MRALRGILVLSLLALGLLFVPAATAGPQEACTESSGLTVEVNPEACWRFVMEHGPSFWVPLQIPDIN